MNADDLAWATVTPKKHRHEWGPDPDGGYRCWRCMKPKDEARSRRSRNNRKRGNAIQRKRIVALGGRNLAGNNPNWDGEGEMFSYESKSGGAFSERVWRWLKGIPVRAQQTQVLIVTDTPGPGHRARAYVVVEYDAWRDLHGELPPPPVEETGMLDDG